MDFDEGDLKRGPQKLGTPEALQWRRLVESRGHWEGEGSGEETEELEQGIPWVRSATRAHCNMEMWGPC